MSRPLTYPFNELTKEGKSVRIAAHNYLKRNSIGSCARTYAKTHGFSVKVARDGGEVVITRVEP